MSFPSFFDATMSLLVSLQRTWAVALCLVAALACTGEGPEAPSQPIPVQPVATATPVPTPDAPTTTAPPMPHPPAESARLAPQDIDLSLERIATGLEKPLFLTHAGDGSGRLFLVEQPGRIVIWRDGTLLPEPFLDIRDRVNDLANERGLLGLAFPPDHVKSLQFYVNYSAPAGQTRISRFTVSPTNLDQAWPESEEVILEIAQPAANHNGGMIAFGPDGMLWIGMGDGGGSHDRYGTGQNPRTLLAKMLRIDVRAAAPGPYTVPADNPWIHDLWQGQPMLPEVWAVGLRNPWRFSFDRHTGDLWIADVGQDRYEEVSFVPAPLTGGLNFGWPMREGTHCLYGADCPSAGLVAPVVDFLQQGGICSITGGYVYRGHRYPAAAGGYVVGDYCSGEIWMIAPPDSGSQEWAVTLLRDTEYRISSFGEDEDGELYLVAQEGQIYRIHLTAS